MACTHKFFGHDFHLQGINGLLPNWDVKTLIIGTFNPELQWHPNNVAKYYYGRTRNYFWRVLPRFAGLSSINSQDINSQISFLKANQIGVTDLLISINDADLSNPNHIKRIQTVLDNEIELFKEFTWNTEPIIDFLLQNDVKAVYFTKLGNNAQKKIKPNTFEEQIRKIELACQHRNIYTNRLHTPSGQGLGAGSPRENVLIHRWYNSNGGNAFPFVSSQFDIKKFLIL